MFQVIALNKIDHADADKNIAKISKMQDPNSLVLCSAISEIFLRRLAKQKYINYVAGSEYIDTREDLIEAGDPGGGDLKQMDEKLTGYVDHQIASRLLDLTLTDVSKTSRISCCFGLAVQVLSNYFRELQTCLD